MSPNWWGIGVQGFIYNHRYKRYADGRFYDMHADPLQQSPLVEKQMNDLHLRVRDHSQAVLERSPADPPKLARPKKNKQ